MPSALHARTHIPIQPTSKPHFTMNPLHNELQIEGQFEALNTNVTT